MCVHVCVCVCMCVHVCACILGKAFPFPDMGTSSWILPLPSPTAWELQEMHLEVSKRRLVQELRRISKGPMLNMCKDFYNLSSHPSWSS